MFQGIPLIFKRIFIFSLLAVCASCTYYPEKESAKNYKTDEPFTKTFYGNYTDVWTAVGKAMGNYRTTVMDREAGYIESVEKPFDDGWISPNVTNIPPSGRRYKLIVRILRGENRGRKAVSVSVKKVIKNRVDFFSQDKEEASDGLEEQSILYRVEREYKIAKGIDKYYKSKEN